MNCERRSRQPGQVLAASKSLVMDCDQHNGHVAYRQDGSRDIDSPISNRTSPNSSKSVISGKILGQLYAWRSERASAP